jgi:hypothetical protein
VDREAAIELSNEWYDVVRGDEALSVQSNSRAAAAGPIAAHDDPEGRCRNRQRQSV